MNDRFLRACRREPVDTTPVWFLRQAGRYMPEYRALREKYSLLELCRTAELAAQVTLQPLRFGVDAAILFADILLPLDPMGAPFEFAKGEGPVLSSPLRTLTDIETLRLIDPQESLGYCLEAIRILRRDLKIPLIGFAGGPFTLASYLIEGGHSNNYAKTKRLMYSEPQAWHLLLSKLTEVVRRFLKAQIEAGAQAVQVFDSWIGQLNPEDYVESVQPHMRTLFSDLQTSSVPVIHFGTGTGSLLEEMTSAGGSVIGIDWRIELGKAWQRVGFDKAVQGNLDPTVLLGPRETIQKRARAVLNQAGSRPGHIFNLGHGILPETPVAEVAALVDFVHCEAQRSKCPQGAP